MVTREYFRQTWNEIIGEDNDILDTISSHQLIDVDGKFLIVNNDEDIYIIDTNSFEGVNWYKTYHIGRALNTSMDCASLTSFLCRFQAAWLDMVDNN